MKILLDYAKLLTIFFCFSIVLLGETMQCVLLDLLLASLSPFLCYIFGNSFSVEIGKSGFFFHFGLKYLVGFLLDGTLADFVASVVLKTKKRYLME